MSWSQVARVFRFGEAVGIRQSPEGGEGRNLLGTFADARSSMDAIVAAVSRAYRLTPQEARILQAVTRGQASKEMAFDMGISRRTVDYYWRQIFVKLRCRSQLEVMALLLRRATGTVDRFHPPEQHPGPRPAGAGKGPGVLGRRGG
jgi:DNA-binding CsgD family transcriptional regulator